MALAAGTTVFVARFFSASKVNQPLTSLEEIKTLTHINGVSLDTIDSRAQPQTCESFRGFLPRGVTLKESLINSWTESAKFQIRHTEIADILDSLCSDKTDRQHNFYVMRQIDLNQHCPGLADFAEPNQNLSVIVRQHRPENPIQDTDIFRGYWEKAARKTTCEITITNCATKNSIIWTPLRSEFIRKYGFYASGIEFKDVLFVLTGKTKENLDKELEKHSFQVVGQTICSPSVTPNNLEKRV